MKTFIFILFCVFTLPVIAQRKMPVTFVKIESGNVLIVKDSHYKETKLLIPFIEAPSKEQPQMYAVAKQHLEDLVKNKSLEVVVLDVAFGYFDVIYGTLLANGRDVGLQMVRDGAAWHFIPKNSIQTEEQRKIYLDNQERAKIEKLGIWENSLPSPTELKKLKVEKYKKLIPEVPADSFVKETKAQLVENWSLFETDEIRVSELLAVKSNVFNKFNLDTVGFYFILFTDKKAYGEETKLKIIADGKEIPLSYTKSIYKERMQGLYQDRYDGIELFNGINFFDFIDLANAKKVSIEIEGKVFELNKGAIDSFRALCRKIEL